MQYLQTKLKGCDTVRSYLITAQGAILQAWVGEQLAAVRCVEIVLYIFSDGQFTCSCQIAATRTAHNPEGHQQLWHYHYTSLVISLQPVACR